MNVLAVPPAEFSWIERRTGCVLTRNARAIKAVDRCGLTVGMVAYDSWTENAVQAHMAVDSPIAWRSLLWPAFAYPFEQAGLGVLLAVINAGNTKSLDLALHFGFREAHRLVDGWAKGEDIIFLEMRREKCRWLERRRKAA